MSSIALAVTVQLEQVTCGECGGIYAIAERVVEQKRKHAGYWNCPYCKCNWGYAKGELQKAREELIEERNRHHQTLSRLNTTESKLRKVEKEAKRIENRIEKGVCPCCNRTFLNLQKHMQTKHPEFP